MPTPRTPQTDWKPGNKSKASASKTRAAKLVAEAASGVVSQGINYPPVAVSSGGSQAQGMGGQELPSRAEAPGEQAAPKAGPHGQAGTSGAPSGTASPGPTPGQGQAKSEMPSPRKRLGPKQAGLFSAKKKPGANLDEKDKPPD